MVDKSSEIIKSRWTKNQERARQQWRCSHGHSGIQHPNCYLKENNIQERKGCLDIEAGGLKGDFDIMLSWAIKTSGKDDYIYDHLTASDITKGLYDSRIMATLIEHMWGFDRLITHYGGPGRFDLGFIRARYLWLIAPSRKLYKGERLPGYGEMYYSDTYPMAKRALTISSRRQNSIANTILGEDIKTKIDRDYWMDIKYGNARKRQKAIDYIIEHNILDCKQLDENYLTLLPFVKETRSFM